MLPRFHDFFGDSDTGFIGALNEAADWVGGAINDVQDFFTKDLTPHEITEFAEATAMLTSAVNEGANSYSAYGDEAVQFLNDMADATEAANASGKNMELIRSASQRRAAYSILRRRALLLACDRQARKQIRCLRWHMRAGLTLRSMTGTAMN